jgi:hypothetical protein
MASQEAGKTPVPIKLSDDDAAYLFSLLRDPSTPQPVTTQQLIDALRARSGNA